MQPKYVSSTDTQKGYYTLPFILHITLLKLHLWLPVTLTTLLEINLTVRNCFLDIVEVFGERPLSVTSVSVPGDWFRFGELPSSSLRLLCSSLLTFGCAAFKCVYKLVVLPQKCIAFLHMSQVAVSLSVSILSIFGLICPPLVFTLFAHLVVMLYHTF